MVSNHGGRQLDGSRSPFDQLAEIVDAVGDKLDVICEGGFQKKYICSKYLAKASLDVDYISCSSCCWSSRC